MPLFQSDVYDAFREVGVSHDAALRAACALYVAPCASPVSVARLGWPIILATGVLGACLFFAGHLFCEHGHSAAQSTALRERLNTLAPLSPP